MTSRRPVTNPGLATSTTATPAAARQLHETGREPVRARGLADVAAEPRVCCVTEPDEVVDQAEGARTRPP